MELYGTIAEELKARYVLPLAIATMIGVVGYIALSGIKSSNDSARNQKKGLALIAEAFEGEKR